MQMITRQSRPRHTRRGATMVLVVLCLLVLFGIVGLALDWATVYLTGTRLQTAADAAALAGAQRIWYGHVGARDAAIATAAENYAGQSDVTLDPNLSNLPDGDIVLGQFSGGVFTPTLDPLVANAVRVNARRTAESPDGPLNLLFGPVFDKDTAEVARYATAVAEGGPVYADIISLDPDDPSAFYAYGDTHLVVGNGEGSIQVNSNNTTNNVGGSLIQGTSVTVDAGDIYVVGTNEERGKPNLPDIHEYSDFVPDPLADLPEPNVPDEATYPATPKITGTGEFHPGYYPEGLEMNAGDNVFLHPGVYVLDEGFRLNGWSVLQGYGVMFFLHTGSIHDNGTGDVHLTPPSEGTYEGIQFFQARDNTEPGDFNGDTTWSGMESDDVNTPTIDESTAGAGTFYFPNAHVEFGGNGQMSFNGLIANTIEMYGTGDIYVTGGYNDEDGTRRVYIVE